MYFYKIHTDILFKFSIYYTILLMFQPLRADELYCDNVVQNKPDPALLKTYPESVVQVAKSCFSRVYNLSLQPVVTQTVDNIYIKMMHLVNETAAAANNKSPMKPQKPILFLHGLLATSSMWLFTQQPTDLVFQLFQSNYDIWLGNERSNYFSVNKHSAPLVGPSTYWNYSWHEVGLRDVPAMIDYILNATNAKKLRIVCHSQGCPTILVMASLMPEYARKIHIIHALAPAVYLHNAKSSAYQLAKNFFKQYKDHLNYAVAMNFSQICFSSAIILNKCLANTYKIMGQTAVQYDMNLIPIVFYHYPTISSLRQSMHLYQSHVTARFAPYDEGFLAGQPTNPPEYPLGSINIPIALYSCDQDLLVDAADVQHLAKRLSNVVENKLFSKCNHLDPIIDINIGKYIYESIMKLDDAIKQ